MKKIITTAVFLVASLFVGGAAFAQSQSVALPSAGLTPESPFYFFDKFGEALQRFFTFNPESRARLEITFAKERIAEIKLVLEEKGVNAKGLSVAEAGLQDNLSRATAILADQKQAGKDTSNIAKELSAEITPAQDALKDTFKSQKNALETKEDELKAKIKEARRAGDTAQVDALTKQLADIKVQKELLDQNENDNEEAIDRENEKIDEAMESKEEAAEKIREAEKDKAEILKEAKEENQDVPAEAFNAFDSLLSQAKAAFDSGNYEEAKRLAKDAKKNLKNAEKSLEKLQDVKEKEDELKQEAEEQQQELEEKLKEEVGTLGEGKEVVEDETAGWKLYSGHGFQIKYPKEWEMRQGDTVTTFGIFNKPTYGFTISKINNPGKLGSHEYAEKWKEDFKMITPQFSLSYESEKDVLVTNQNGYEFYGLSIGVEDEPKMELIFVSLPEKKLVYQIEFPTAQSNIKTANPQGNNKLAHLMFSTLQFIDSNETANWKMYTNSEFKYQISYPESFEIRPLGESQRCITKIGKDFCKLILNTFTLSSYKLVDHAGGFIFRYDKTKKQWFHDKSNETSQFVPQKATSSLEAYLYNTGDVKCATEYILIPDISSDRLIEINNITCRDDNGNREEGYEDISSEQILSTFRFLK